MRNDKFSTEIEKAFEFALMRISRTIPCDPSWMTENGYFPGAVDYPLKSGEVVKSICKETNRRLILVGTLLGTVVVFERFNPTLGQKFVLIHSSPESLNHLLGTSALSLAQFTLVVTNWDIEENIGVYLEKIYGEMHKNVERRESVCKEPTSPGKTPRYC